MTAGVRRQALARIVAWLVDWACILVWVAIVAAVGVPLYLFGVTRALDTGAVLVVSTVVLVVPVTVVFARWESGPRQATPGKRSRRLVVVRAGTGTHITFARSLLRTTLRVAVPWTLGHATALAIVATSENPTTPAWVWPLTAITYLLPIAYLVALFVGTGRTPYDRLAGTAVIRREPGNSL